MASRQYDWEKLMRRRKFVFKKGRDYFCGNAAIAQQIRNAASVRGVKVRLMESDDSFTVLVFRPTTETQEALFA